MAQAIGRALRAIPDDVRRGVAVVHLAGRVDGDERVALRSVARQLCAALGQCFAAAATFDDNLAFVRDALARMRRRGDAAVFVLHAFELFLKRPRPTTVYNLLDLLQSSAAPAAVVGVTTDLFALEHMEKRARSRFSHRKVELHLPSDACAAAEVRRRAGRARTRLCLAARQQPVRLACRALPKRQQCHGAAGCEACCRPRAGPAPSVIVSPDRGRRCIAALALAHRIVRPACWARCCDSHPCRRAPTPCGRRRRTWRAGTRA